MLFRCFIASRSITFIWHICHQTAPNLARKQITCVASFKENLCAYRIFCTRLVVKVSQSFVADFNLLFSEKH
jgi:hypothetical protein